MGTKRLILGIDPGNEWSAAVLLHVDGGGAPAPGDVVWRFWGENEDLLAYIHDRPEHDGLFNVVANVGLACEFACEGYESFGMAVGRTVFDTCIWIGRFMEAWDQEHEAWRIVYRTEVKLHLCHSRRAKDKNVRQALLDKWPATGGGNKPEIGTKKEPGPLYGMSKHLWSALAVAVTAAETEE